MKKFLTLISMVLISMVTFASPATAPVKKAAEGGDLNAAIAKAISENATELDLNGGSWTLSGTAELPVAGFTIKNGTIVADAAGNIAVQSGLILENVVIDATAEGAIAPIQLSANPDASLATFTDAVGTEGEEGYVPASMKYANASWKGYEAQEITIKNSKVMTANSLIRPAAAWALRALNIDNTIVEVKYKSGKAIINMEENGAGVIQDINIKNSTIYADDAATEMRFHRYAAQNDPWRVWGYEGEDKNVTKDTWTLENNTFVGVCGNKEFSNNMKNTNATEFTFKNNAFVNTWRINKLGGNCKRNFEQADNVISGGTNAVDGTDANWFTAVDDLGAVWNFETAPAATDAEALGDAFGLYEDYKAFGDPRWAANAKPEPTEISEMVVGKKALTLKADKEYTLNANAVLGLDVVTINGNGATIKVGEAGKFSVQKGIILDNVVLDGTATANAIVELSATPDASLATFTDAVGTEGEEGYVPATMKYEGANQKVYEAERVEINNSTFITNNSVIRPGAAWALRNLSIDNSIIEVKYKSGKAIINMEENGANSVQNIAIKNSTIYADDAATDMRFIRYTNASNAQSQKVWGTADNNASITLTNNTFVGVCGNKEFANNYVNKKLYQFTFKNNACINTWRINKLGTNNTRNFEQADNVISGGTQTVDGTDAGWFTSVDDLGAVWNFGDGEGQTAAPAATDMEAMGAAFGLYEYYKNSSFGDPRWDAYAKENPTAIQNVNAGAAAKNGVVYNLNGQRVNANAKGIVIINGNKYLKK